MHMRNEVEHDLKDAFERLPEFIFSRHTSVSGY